MIDQTRDHDLEASIASRAILEKWRSDSYWSNQFVDDDVSLSSSSHQFPSPDQSFYSRKSQSSIAMEFKPAFRETKRGILTGLGQSIAYLTDKINSASVLVIPDRIDNFNIGDFMENLFQEHVYNKLPIALITFEEGHPENIKLRCNFSSDPSLKIKTDEKRGNVTYWAAFRDNYPSHVYYLLKTALNITDHSPTRISNIWDKFHYDFYCFPPETKDTLELLPSRLHNWSADEVTFWRKSTKIALQKAIDNQSITIEEALARLRWDAANNKEERLKQWDIFKNMQFKIPKQPDRDNYYEGLKKNMRDFISHLGLWENTSWIVSSLGRKLISRIDLGNDPLDEIASICLVKGRFSELINDIKKFQLQISNPKNNGDFREELKKRFIEKGYIGLNPGRASSQSRPFLQAETQLLGRFNIIEKKGSKYFHPKIGFKFNENRINYLRRIFYSHYHETD